MFSYEKQFNAFVQLLCHKRIDRILFFNFITILMKMMWKIDYEIFFYRFFFQSLLLMGSSMLMAFDWWNDIYIDKNQYRQKLKFVSHHHLCVELHRFLMVHIFLPNKKKFYALRVHKIIVEYRNEMIFNIKTFMTEMTSS